MKKTKTKKKHMVATTKSKTQKEITLCNSVKTLCFLYTRMLWICKISLNIFGGVRGKVFLSSTELSEQLRLLVRDILLFFFYFVA